MGHHSGVSEPLGASKSNSSCVKRCRWDYFLWGGWVMPVYHRTSVMFMTDYHEIRNLSVNDRDVSGSSIYAAPSL